MAAEAAGAHAARACFPGAAVAGALVAAAATRPTAVRVRSFVGVRMPLPTRPAGRGYASVGGLARVYLADPRHDAAAHVHGVGIAGSLDDREHLCGPDAGLAVQDDRLVAGQVAEGVAVEELALRDQLGARDAVDLELVGLTDVDELEVAGALLALLEHHLELGDRDRRAGGGLGGLVGDGAAEGVVVDETGDCRVVTAQRAVRVLADLELAPLQLEGVVDDELADGRVTDAGDQLDRLVDLDRADAGAQDAEHAALGAAGDHARRRGLGVEAAVARGVVGQGRREDGRLAVKAVDRAPDVGDLQEVGGVVDHVAGREVVGAVDDEVVALEDLEHVVVVEALVVHDDLDVGVDLGDRLLGGLGLGATDVGHAVDDLALEVGLVDLVELRDAERADAGRDQVQQGGRAQAAGADRSEEHTSE